MKTNKIAMYLICIVTISLSACQKNTISENALPSQIEKTDVLPSATNTIQPEATSTPQPTATIENTSEPILQDGENAARFVGESIPDGSYITPGESFTKTWTLENSGTNTWTREYHLVIFASPQGDTLSSPTIINFPEIVQPGEKTEIHVDLIAPQSKGTFAVYWELQNAQGEPFYVDGGNLWTKITVAEPGEQPAQTATGDVRIAQLNGITVELIDIEIGTTSSFADFCVYFSGEEKMVRSTSDISLSYNGKQYTAAGGNSVDINDPATMPGAHRCYHFPFPTEQAALPSGTVVQLSIACLSETGANPHVIEANCAQASIDLPLQYPGLSFTCLPVSSGNFYTGLQTPPNMTVDQADQIIQDAIEKAVYGPWILTKEINP